MKTAYRNPDCESHGETSSMFAVTLKTDEFWFKSDTEETQCQNNGTYHTPPRHKAGTLLLMQYGVNAQSGEIVAVVTPKELKLARYSPGLKYVAVAVLAGDQLSYNKKYSIYQFPIRPLDQLFSAKQ